MDGIGAEQALTAELREHADLVVDTSDLPLPALRQVIERHFGAGADRDQARMVVSLISFAYSRGLPPEADLVFDARFLRNPHYEPMLGYAPVLSQKWPPILRRMPISTVFLLRSPGLSRSILPRFVQEGKKYATITIGCTGGRHRSVHPIEKLATYLTGLTGTTTGEGMRRRRGVST